MAEPTGPLGPPFIWQVHLRGSDAEHDVGVSIPRDLFATKAFSTVLAFRWPGTAQCINPIMEVNGVRLPTIPKEILGDRAFLLERAVVRSLLDGLGMPPSDIRLRLRFLQRDVVKPSLGHSVRVSVDLLVVKAPADLQFELHLEPMSRVACLASRMLGLISGSQPALAIKVGYSDQAAEVLGDEPPGCVVDLKSRSIRFQMAKRDAEQLRQIGMDYYKPYAILRSEVLRFVVAFVLGIVTSYLATWLWELWRSPASKGDP